MAGYACRWAVLPVYSLCYHLSKKLNFCVRLVLTQFTHTRILSKKSRTQITFSSRKLARGVQIVQERKLITKPRYSAMSMYRFS